jgi:DNA-binding LytR/AlgR family response regulator
LAGIGHDSLVHNPVEDALPNHAPAAVPVPEAQRPLPLGGLGQPRIMPSTRLPVEGADGTHLMDAAEVRSIRADAHYTQVHDGNRERMCAWSISQAEAHLDPAVFMRVHRSHIIAVPHVVVIRKEGDGAVVELNGPTRHLVPVSRARIAELRARLGLLSRNGSPLPREGQSA